jgi:hypothetical protein
MAAKPGHENDVKLRNAFNELNAFLSNAYDEDKLPLLRDLIVEHIFIERPSISALPLTEAQNVRNALAEELATKFMNAYADTMWAFRDQTPDIEEFKRLSLVDFIMAVFGFEANM